MEIEFTGLIGLILAGILAIGALVLHSRQPGVLKKRITLNGGDMPQDGLRNEDIEAVVRAALDQHCPYMQERLMSDVEKQISRTMSDSVIAFRELMVEWKGGVDARLEGTVSRDSELGRDIRELRKEINMLRAELKG
jgi:hypothetical protein